MNILVSNSIRPIAIININNIILPWDEYDDSFDENDVMQIIESEILSVFGIKFNVSSKGGYNIFYRGFFQYNIQFIDDLYKYKTIETINTDYFSVYVIK